MPFLIQSPLRKMLCACMLGGLIQLSVAFAFAQNEVAKPAPVFPTDSNLWLNTSPLTWEQLRGKGVVLYYFSCDPDGAELLPKAMDAARKHVADPVILIGVTMGNTRQETEAYLKKAGFQWPVLCDPTYSFAHQTDKVLESKASELFADSSTGIAIVTFEGTISEGDWEDPEASFTDANEGAAWTTDPKDIPAPLLPTWRAVELKKYAEALPLLKKGVNTGPNEQKEAARQLQQVVLTEIERIAEEARTADEQDQKWNAYRKVSRIMEDFRGYDIPKDLDVLQKKLARSSEVKLGLTAEKQLTIAAQGIVSPNSALKKKAVLQLEKVISDFPDTDLAMRARKLIDDSQQKPMK